MSTRREHNLMFLINTLWEHLSPQKRQELDHLRRNDEIGWAIPESWDHLDDDDWLTPEQVAYECGVTPSTVRNWPERHGIRKVRGRYRWGDVRELMRQRRLRYLEGRH